MKTLSCSALSLAVLLAVAPPAAAVDPFYSNRMKAGIQAFEAGDWPAAARQLRIACFGYLDEPVALAAGLIHLAVAQGETGANEALRATFLRLIQLEERFSAYSGARVPPSVRERFERHAAQRVPLETLRFAAGFEAIAERAEIEKLAGLPADERREALESRLAAEPDRPALLLEMARLELQVKRPRAAFAWLDRLSAEQRTAPAASCLRQQAAAESRDCTTLDPQLPFCEGVPTMIVEFSLRCLVDEVRWEEAAAVLAQVPSTSERSGRLARLERKIARNLPAPPSDGEPAGQPPEPQPGKIPPATGAGPSAGVGGPSAGEPEEQEIDRLRSRLAEAVTAEQLGELFAAVEDLAERQPASREAQLLAAEVAYLRSDWARTVFHFRRAGELRPGEEPLAFYFAVALYESGDAAAAAEVLRPVASRLERSSFVESYLERILGEGI